jgi:hypothetical protein
MDEHNKSNSTQKDGVLRDANGHFMKGTKPIAPFMPDNDLTSKYSTDIPGKMIEWFEKQTEETNRYPTFERFARSIGVLHATMKNWAKNPEKYEGFADAYATCKEIQASVLTENTLGKLYEPSFAKFVATNTLGMIDQSAVKVQGDADQPLKVNIEIVE